jgi:hypothetical protein
MSVVDDVEQIWHRIKIRLYSYHLPGRKEGELIARTENEKVLFIEDISKEAKERGGYTGNVDDLNNHVAVFLREVAHQLCDGYEINFGGLFAIYPNVGGVFENEHEPIDKDKHKISFRFRTLNGLRKLAERIEVVSEGLADTLGYLMEIVDVTTGLANDVVTKNGIFMLSGNKMKISGEADQTGVYFVAANSPDMSVKVTTNLAVNEPTKIIGTVPELQPDKDWYVEVRTNFSGTSTKPLKDTRVIRSKFTVKQA